MSYGITNLYTGLTPPRLANLMAYSFFVHEFRGSMAEFGVMKGGSLDLLSSLHPNKKIYGIDGFKGLPAPGTADTHKAGEFALSDREYTDMDVYFKMQRPNVTILKGYSPQVFKLIPKETEFSFVHIDVDLFDSVNDALDYFFPRLIEGGVMIFDDYGFDSTPGAKLAIDQWKGICRYRGELRFTGDIFCGQYLVIK